MYTEDRVTREGKQQALGHLIMFFRVHLEYVDVELEFDLES